MNRAYRMHFGPVWNEGARLTWMAKERASLTNGELAKIAGCGRGQLVKILYGDQRAGRAIAGKLSDRFQIPMGSWDEAPSEAFVLPATRPVPEVESTSDISATIATAASVAATGTDDR